MKVYALTGGIAAGKSEASKRFEEQGIPVIDADKVAHEVIAPGGIAEKDVIDTFGDGILTCGKIDRDKLGAIVFDDEEARKKLNAIVHPAVRTDIANRLAALTQAGHAAAIVDAALHAENGELGPGFEGLILIDCPSEDRRRRLVELRGMTEEAAMSRIRAQTPPEEKKGLARWIVTNDGDLDHLRRQVDAVAEDIRRDAE